MSNPESPSGSVPAASAADGDKVDILARAVAALDADDLERGRQILRSEYPFSAVAKNPRRYTERQSLRVFYRDGFRDRYSGTTLVHPGALRTLSLILPDEFLFHSNWAVSQEHVAFWELCPTIDHLVPVARGGVDGRAEPCLDFDAAQLRHSALDARGAGVDARPPPLGTAPTGTV